MKPGTAIGHRPFATLSGGSTPSVVIVVPFTPTMTSKAQLDISLKSLSEEAERHLLANYTHQIAKPVIARLREQIRGLNYATHHKSLLLTIGTDAAKALYFDLPVKPQVFVDGNFHLRDLTKPADSSTPFLIMLLSSKISKLFRYDGCKLSLIKDNVFHPVYAYTHELPERVANFSDPHTIKDQLLDKFLRHMDEGLSIMLENYDLPVFLLGVDKVVGHFNQITRNSRHIAASIPRNCMNLPEKQLLEVLQPYMKNWFTIRQGMALKHAEAALEAGKLSHGLEAVSKASVHANSRLLILEKRFGTVAEPNERVPPEQDGQLTPDPIDTIIEKVLQCGGRVEWVDDGLLQTYEGIALISYY